MNSRTGRTFLRWTLAAALTLPAAALTAQTSSVQVGGSGSHGSHGSHGSQGGHGGTSHGGNGSHGGSSYGGHRGHSGGHYGGRSGGYYGGYIGLGGYGWYGYPYYGGFGYYGYPGYGYNGGGYTTVYPTAGATMGALDLDVSPEGAQIYVDGKLAGVADDFDGYPTFLWLDKGTYDVVIFAPGFQTISRQYSIYGGMVIDVEDSMVPGKETMPQDLVSKSTVNREERLRRDRENEDRVRADEDAPGQVYGTFGSDEAEDGRGEAADRLDARGEPGSLKLGIEPGDASVYLDGRFLGTGRELARLRSGLIVDPGEHRIEVVRPGRESQAKTFSVGAGEEVRLDIELAAQ